jgi:hypothetical protein
VAEIALPRRTEVERDLQFATVNWPEVAETRPRWDSLDAAEKESYHHEWWNGAHLPLERLRAWERAGSLNDDQCARLAELQPLIKRNESFLASVFAEQ